jgi:hypothetical protein
MTESTAKRTTRKRKSRRTFGNVWKLPSGRYRASYIAPDGKRRGGENTFATVSDASAWLSTIETEMLRGDWRPPEPARETFGSYGKRWLATRADHRPSTVERYERLWRLLARADLRHCAARKDDGRGLADVVHIEPCRAPWLDATE